jgi:hypothetical protein
VSEIARPSPVLEPAMVYRALDLRIYAIWQDCANANDAVGTKSSIPGESGPAVGRTNFAATEFYSPLTIESIRAAVARLKEYSPF